MMVCKRISLKSSIYTLCIFCWIYLTLKKLMLTTNKLELETFVIGQSVEKVAIDQVDII